MPHAEFVYNMAPSYVAKHSLFEFVYDVNLLTPTNFLALPSEPRVNNQVYKERVNKHTKKMEFNP